MCRRCKKNTNPAMPECATWGLSADAACRSCFDTVLGNIDQYTTGMPLAYREDYAKIYMLLDDRAKSDEYLLAFNSDLAGHVNGQIAATTRPAKSAVDPQYVRLSKCLGYYERRCWFPPSHLLPLGLLTTDDFLYYIRMGHVLKDYGAGVRHGEFTHRLQWQIIIRANTANFANANPAAQGWNKSPLDLYVTLGKPTARGVSGTLWFLLLDNPGPGPSYRFPDALHRSLLANTTAQVLAHNLSSRERKRRDEFVAAYKRELDASGVDFSGVAQPTDHEKFIEYSKEVNSRLTKAAEARFPVPFQKTVVTKSGFFSALRGPTQAEIDQANDKFNAINAKISVEATKQKDQWVRAHFDNASASNSRSYIADKAAAGTYAADSLLPGGVQKVTTDLLHTQEQVDQRVAQSISGFCTEPV